MALGVFAAGMLAAAWIRFGGLEAESFWVDEILSAEAAAHPWGEILDQIPKDKPPLDYYVQAAFDRAGRRIGRGEPEFWNRLPAALAGLATLVAVYVWAGVWFGRWTALWATLLAAFNGMLIYYAREARPYSLFVALATWQQAVFALWWLAHRRAGEPRKGEPRKGAWRLTAVLFALSVAAAYTLYAAFLIFMSQAAFVALAWRRGEAWRNRGTTKAVWIYGAICAGVLLAIWPLRLRASLFPASDYPFRFEGLELGNILRHVLSPFLPITNMGFAIVAGLGVYLVLRFGLPGLWRRRRRGVLQIGLSSLLWIPMLFFVYWFIDRKMESRYLIFCAPGCCILLAACFQELGRRMGRREGTDGARRSVWMGSAAWPMPTVVVAFALAGGLLHVGQRPTRPDWRGIVGHIIAHAAPGERVVVPAYPEYRCIRHYLHHRYHYYIAIYTDIELDSQPRPGATWMVDLRPARDTGSPFYMLHAERVGVPPGEAALARWLPAPGGSSWWELGTMPTALLGVGWAVAERWGAEQTVRWATCRTATLYLPLGDSEAGRLTIRCRPYDFVDASPQRIQPTLAGVGFEARAMPPGQFTNLEWIVPAGVAARGANTLDLTFDFLATPHEYKRNHWDFRTLAAVVEWVRWEPLPAAPPGKAPARNGIEPDRQGS